MTGPLGPSEPGRASDWSFQPAGMPLVARRRPNEQLFRSEETPQTEGREAELKGLG